LGSVKPKGQPCRQPHRPAPKAKADFRHLLPEIPAAEISAPPFGTKPPLPGVRPQAAGPRGRRIKFSIVNRHSNLIHHRRPKLTHRQGGWGFPGMVLAGGARGGDWRVAKPTGIPVLSQVLLIVSGKVRAGAAASFRYRFL
jgi:hypothetical protein